MHSMIRTSATVVFTATVLTACSAVTTSSAPTVPAAIAVPAGNALAFTLKGSGLLNYECRAKADAPGTFDWVLASPDAVLKDKNDALVGKYYGGPTWEHADGSKVTGKQLAVAPAPAAGNIPWQLVQATPSSGPMTMNGISYVQRINTVAGVAPAEPCTASVVASKKQVRYSADYLFYKS
ncbi:MAG: DUF3455 domain-containing protein [Burkholderiaceae bacterium]